MLVSRNFVDLITFSRSSPAWRFNSSGILVQETDGVPRFDYDPVTLQPRGMLIEEARTNLVLRSSEFDNASWSKSNMSVTANAATGPDGAMSAEKIIPTTTSGTHGVNNSSSTVSGSTMYYWSVFAKAGEYKNVRLRAADSVGFLGDMIVDLTTGIISNPSPTAIAQPLGGGWYRLTIGFTTNASPTSITHGVWVYDNTGGATFSGDGTSGLYVFGAQLEQGAFPTSYITTVGATATRAADVASITDLGKIGFNPAQGTLYAETRVGALGNSASANTFPHMACFAKGANIGVGDYIGLRISQPDAVHVNVGNAGVFNSVVPPGSATTVGATEKVAAAGQGASIVAARNGSVSAAITSRTWPVDVDTLWIGSQVGNTRFWNGWIRALRYYPRRLSDAELQALTA
ncbi:phage head spike fiber domain-containing protein [Cupriavidus taiwanensis]|uniref:phage head spike fiber domain-containing protein n=1 Tax=Cupriavidus taiwanensis TaxID=164546 RepID=UPI000E105690|nr:hypothetical protein [Cupriavidus taiwanensis]SOY56870.1 conserved hypothetical protein [Cupriavidus taiwanensis]SOY90815.1 conserved hypothetical protein [Cupriavidus taiwanensis]SOZ63602.1 conserved hypothetical protein [Cupriavidus taiwanensis]SOZ82622.1 conserved hypothetical protein [Cupriavidus taiwanensis]SOZ84459.1 conserved hypothetical protein [Cupriavidus taiwanensis]